MCVYGRGFPRAGSAPSCHASPSSLAGLRESQIKSLCKTTHGNAPAIAADAPLPLRAALRISAGGGPRERPEPRPLRATARSPEGRRTERRSSEPSIASARNEPSPTPRRLKTLLGAEKLSNPVRGRENALSRAEPAPLTRTAPARSVSRRGRGSLGLPPPPLFAPSGGSAISNGGTDRRRPTR